MPRGRCPADAETQAGCKYAPACFSDLHHEFWPKAAYEAEGALAARWRNLGKHTVQICRAEHDERHATQTPPAMPSRPEMIDDLAATDEVLAGEIRRKVRRSLARRAIVENLTEVIADLSTVYEQGDENEGLPQVL